MEFSVCSFCFFHFPYSLFSEHFWDPVKVKEVPSPNSGDPEKDITNRLPHILSPAPQEDEDNQEFDPVEATVSGVLHRGEGRRAGKGRSRLVERIRESIEGSPEMQKRMLEVPDNELQIDVEEFREEPSDLNEIPVMDTVEPYDPL